MDGTQTQLDTSDGKVDAYVVRPEPAGPGILFYETVDPP
jgi:hypothetical protein